MPQPTRYDPILIHGGCWDAYAGMGDYPDGDYVKVEDWQEVADELTILEIKYANLVKALGELYKKA